MQCDVKDELPSSSLSETKDNTASTSLPKTKDDTSVPVTKSDAEACGVGHTGEHEKDKEKHLEDQDDTSCLEIQNIKFIDSSESDLTVCGKKTEKSENQIKDSYVIPEEESEKHHTGEECQKLDHKINGKEKIEIVQETVHKEQTENVSEISDSLNSDQTKESEVKNMENKVLEQSNIDKVKEREITQNMEPKEREKIQNMEPKARETTQSRESKERGVSPDIQIQDSEQVPNVSDKPKNNTEEYQNEDLSDSAVIKIEGVEVKETDVDDLEGVGKDENTEGSETPDKEDEKEYEIPSIEAFLPFTNYVNLKKLNIDKFAAFVDNTDRENVLMHYLKHKDLKKLKSLLRHSPWSVNHPIRDSLWSHVCRYLHKAEGNVYEEFEKDLFANRPNVDIHLPSFVDYDNLMSYYLSEDGLKTVKKIMMILQHTNPDITYSPTLFEIVCMFLHYMSPSDTYNCVYGLLRAKDKNYIVQTKVAVEASKLVMKDLTKKFAKSAYVYLVRNSSSIEAVFETWMWWIFSDLPFPYLVKIFDCYLLEGVKVLYRVILAILITFTKYSAKRRTPGTTTYDTSNGNLVSCIRQFCKDIPVTVEKLLKTGFGIRGFTRKEIRKLQVKNEMYVNSRHLLNHEVPKSHSTHSALSRTFSGPMSLQHVESSIFTVEMLYNIWSWLPPRYAVCQPELLYTSEEHGTSLMTLYTRAENHEPTLIVIKTTTDEVFGAFCSTYWRDRRHKNKNLSYFGTGETFLFTLVPERKKYEWVGLHQSEIPNTANMFLAGDNSVLTIGGGHGEAIQLDANLLHCRTEKCDTFDNSPLCASQDFTCRVVEVYGFH